MRTFTFVEPHITGGIATVTITDDQIMEYMRRIKSMIPAYDDSTDEQLFNQFVDVHCCTEMT